MRLAVTPMSQSDAKASGNPAEAGSHLPQSARIGVVCRRRKPPAASRQPRPSVVPMIEVTDLRKQFGEFAAVRRHRSPPEPGAIFGLLGPNGAGKTTTIGCVAAF